MNRVLKIQIDIKTKLIIQDLDKIINEDMDWIYQQCKKDNRDYNEFIEYYIKKLQKYELFNPKSNNHKPYNK